MKLNLTITLLALAATIHPAFARIGEDEKQLEARYGTPEGKKEAEDGTSVLAFRRGDLAIEATLWKGKSQQMTYYTKTEVANAPLPALGEAKVKELLAENAPGEEWEKKDNLHLAAKAKLEAEEKGGVLVIYTQEFKARKPAAAEKPKEAPALDSYIGLTVAEAGARAEGAGLKWRVIMEDGQGKPTTRDYRKDRVNFTVEKGKVTAVENG